MEILLWIIGIVALIAIGAITTAIWVVKKGHKGYTKTRDAIKDRRDQRMQDRK